MIGYFESSARIVVHRPVEVDLHHVVAETLLVDVGQVLGRVGLELLEEDAVAGDLGFGLAVGRAGDADADRAAGAVARQADHAHVVAEVLAAELRADARLLRQLHDRGLQLEVADGVAALTAPGGQIVEVAAARQLDGLECELGRRAADDDGEMIGRAGGGAEHAQLLLDEGEQRRRVEQRLGLLEEERLVGRAAALGDEQEMVFVPRDGVELDLRRQVGAGVHLLVHAERRELRIAQVGARVSLVDAARQRRFVVAAGPHPLALLAEHDRRAGVLTRGQHHPGGDVGVLQHVESDEAVVRRRLGVVEDLAQLRQMAGTEEVRDVADGRGGEPGQPGGRDGENRLAAEAVGGDEVALDTAIGRGVLAVREHLLEGKLGHASLVSGRVPVDASAEREMSTNDLTYKVK